MSLYGRAYELYRDRTGDSHPNSPAAKEFRQRNSHPDVDLDFIGVWDTVGALGVPIPAFRFWNRKRYEFHDTDLSSRVLCAYQALAVDERRKPFLPTLWRKQPHAPATRVLEQAWFPGDHSDAGGGYAETGLSDGALHWMCDRAAASGLALGRAPLGDPQGKMHDAYGLGFAIFGNGTRVLGTTGELGGETVHVSSLRRASYRPANLDRFLRSVPPPKESGP
jgi:uncharacterized protein (DUF2235 family)